MTALPTSSAESASTRPSRLPLRHVLLLAASAALVAGVAQVIVVLVRRDLLHQFTSTSRDVIWMAPLGNLILIIPLAGMLAGLALLLSRRAALLCAAWLCACYAAYSMTLLFPRLHQVAMVLLSLGFAVRFTVAVDGAPDRWLPRLRRLSLALALCVGALSLADRGWRVLVERRAMGALAEARAGAPNVLLLILDTVRAASLELYGYERATAPEIVRRAAEGAVFDWTFATSSWTLPSHGSMFTGRRPDELSARLLDPLDGTHQTLAEVFRENGYATGGFVANHLYTTHESGLDRGFIRYADYRVSVKEALFTGMLSRTDSFRDALRSIFWDRSIGGMIKALRAHHFVSTVRRPDADRKEAGDVNAEFLRWQAGLGGKPFFAFLNYFDAHTPYRPPAAFRNTFSPKPERQDLYDASIASTDQKLAALFEELARRGVLDRTIVVIASDHGEQFGEHGQQQHANSLYTQATRVPLVVRFPGTIPAGLRIARVVTLQDLPATLLQLAGTLVPGRLGGTSFAGLLMGRDEASTSPVIAELEEHEGFGEQVDTPELRALFDDSLHYIMSAGKDEHLYAYRSDPLELQDLLSTPAGARAAQRLRDELRRTSGAAPYVSRPE